MSDGPHRSLPMRKGWKRLVERADRPAFGEDEVAEAIPEALKEDCRDEVSKDFLRAVDRACAGNDQAELFGDAISGSRPELDRLAAGYPLAKLILDCAADMISHEPKNQLKLADVLARALEDRAMRGARQSEEHYKRKSSPARAGQVRMRLEAAISRTDYRALAAGILTGHTDGSPKPKRRKGIDDGVSLP